MRDSATAADVVVGSHSMRVGNPNAVISGAETNGVEYKCGPLSFDGYGVDSLCISLDAPSREL